MYICLWYECPKISFSGLNNMKTYMVVSDHVLYQFV